MSELDGSGALQVTYTNEPQQYGGVISQRRGTTTSTYHADALGSTRALTDSTETVTDTYLYDAWGNEVASSGTTVNPFRWVGRYGYYQDAGTALVYVRARMYQPTVARWVSVDPGRYIHWRLVIRGVRPEPSYAYVDSSPILVEDPSGKCPSDVKISIAAVTVDLPYSWSCAAGVCPFPNATEACEMYLAVFDLIATVHGDPFKGLPPCPCRIKKKICTQYDPHTGAQVEDLVIWQNPNRDLFGDPAPPPCCHPGAANCIRSQASVSGGIVVNLPSGKSCNAGQQCCYDLNGNLITGGSGAGTSDLINPPGFWDECTCYHNALDVCSWACCKSAGGGWGVKLDARWRQNNDNGCLSNVLP